MRSCTKSNTGFTLIELSIVLVIIGLIVGGILTGQDLISAAAGRAQIAQIEKYQTAIHTFQSKYGRQLPGDISEPDASRFGFVARGATKGMGDGDGILEGIQGDNTPNFNGSAQGTGEISVFWRDLSTAGLIDGRFNTAMPGTPPASTPITGSTIGSYLPAAKIGNSTYVYIRSGGTGDPAGSGGSGDGVWFLPVGVNFFGVGNISQIDYQGDVTSSTGGVTVVQAYNIDKKIDDALPVTGSVTIAGFDWLTRVAVTGTASTCADARGNGSGWYELATTNRYSTQINNGAGLNCGLMFRFQ